MSTKVQFKIILKVTSNTPQAPKGAGDYILSL